jgi:O-antigen/teichoic acid export membrane protein
VDRPKSVVRRLPAGIIDASFASLATFAVGLAAVNFLPDAERGIYAIYFTAFLLGGVLPRTLILTPAETETVAFPQEQRIALVPRSISLGVWPALVGASAALLAAAVAAPLTDSTIILPFTLTTAVAGALSPLQDHVRKMLHFGGLSWMAAWVSVVQFGVTIAAILVLRQTGIELAYLPFGALSLANLLSLSFGWVATLRHRRRHPTPARFEFRSLAQRGRWLLLQAAAPSSAGFLAAAIITRLAGPEALGFAEAARVVSQPILVLATGLAVVLSPRAVEAAMARDLDTARRNRHLYLVVVATAGVGYLALAGWAWDFNPMTAIVPSAYEVSGLVALAIAANMATASIFLQFNELLGAKLETTLARISWGTAPILLLGAATAGSTEAFARPLGRLGEAVAKSVAQRTALIRHYDPEPSTAPSPIE